MWNFIYNYGLFFAEAATIVIAILVILSSIVSLTAKSRSKSKEKFEISKLNERYDDIKNAFQNEICNKEELKNIVKKDKEKAKLEQKQAKTRKTTKKRIFVVDFDGDIKASAVENMREEITAILTVATSNDEVLVRIDSSGGMIPHYGLAASQLKRVRDRGIPLVVAVDKIAASGGYMMACVANKILAAPFAIVGSVGVIAQLPNFNRFLKKHDIDFEQIMAGEYKRTLSVLGENTNKGRKKFQEEIEEAHNLFKAFIATHRPIVNINAIATGEHWYGVRAKELRLVDELITSDDYLLLESERNDIFRVTYSTKKNFVDKLSTMAHKCYAKITHRKLM